MEGARKEVEDLLLNVYISSANDGYFLLRTVEIPELNIKAQRLDDIPDVVRTAAAALTGKAPDDFDLRLDY